jgi:hypothetical protein
MFIEHVFWKSVRVLDPIMVFVGGLCRIARMPMDADGSRLAPKITEGSIPRLQRRPLQLPLSL